MSDLTPCENLVTKIEFNQLKEQINKLLGAKQKTDLDIGDLDNHNQAVKQLSQLVPSQYEDIVLASWNTIKQIQDKPFDYSVETDYVNVLGLDKFPEDTVIFNAIAMANQAIQGIEEIDDLNPNLNDAVNDLFGEGNQTRQRRATGNRRFNFVSGLNQGNLQNRASKGSPALSKLGKTTSKSSINLSKTMVKQAKSLKIGSGMIFETAKLALEVANTFVIDKRLDAAENLFNSYGDSFDQTNTNVSKNFNNLKKIEKQFKEDKTNLEKAIENTSDINRDLEARVRKLEKIQKSILERLPEIDELKTDLDELKTEFEQYQFDTDEELLELANQNELFKQQIEEIVSNQTELEKDVNNLQQQIDDLRRRVEILEKGQKELRIQLDENYNNFLKFKETITKKVEFNKKEIEKLDTEIEQLDEELNTLGEYVPTELSIKRRAKIKALEDSLYRDLADGKSKPYTKTKLEKGKVVETRTYKKVIKNGRVVEIEVKKDPLDWYYDLIEKTIDNEQRTTVERKINQKQNRELRQKVNEEKLKKCLREELVDHPEHGSKKDKQDLIDNMPVFPELWNIRKEQIQDQLIVIYRNLDTESKSGNYSLIIPHYDGTRKPKFTPYKKGNHWGRFILKDSSTIIVNCISQNEAKRMINELKKYVKRQYLTENISYGVYPKSHIKQITVKPLRADYYQNRNKEQKQTPTWREYFNNDK